MSLKNKITMSCSSSCYSPTVNYFYVNKCALFRTSNKHDYKMYALSCLRSVVTHSDIKQPFLFAHTSINRSKGTQLDTRI